MKNSKEDKQIFNKENIKQFHEIDKKYLNDEINSEEWKKQYQTLLTFLLSSDSGCLLPETSLLYNYDEQLMRELLSVEHVSAIRKYKENGNKHDYLLHVFCRSLCWFSVVTDRTADEINTLMEILVSVSYPIMWWGGTRSHREWSTRDELKREVLLELVVSGCGRSEYFKERTDVYPKHLINTYLKHVQTFIYCEREQILQLFHLLEKYEE